MKSILDNIKSHDSCNIAIEDENLNLSYGDLYKNVIEVSEIIKSFPSRAIGIYIDNSALWIIISLAIQNANKAIVPIPSFFSPQQIKHVIHDCGIDTIITDRQLVKEQFPPLHNGNDYQWKDKSYFSYRVIDQKQQRCKLDEAISMVTYTSGSTDQPKGVCLSNESLLAVSESIANVLNPLSLQRHLCLLPLSTLLENIAGVWAPFISGSTVITRPLHNIGFTTSNNLDPKTFIACINQHQPDSIILLPEMLKILVGCAVSSNLLPRSLKFCAVGGAKVNPSLIKHAHNLNIPAYEGYGLSECASVVSLNTPSQNKSGTSGKALPHAKIRISPQNEIEVMGSTLNRYLNTNTCFNDAYFPTGDLGYLDEEGYLVIQGRKKNMFITSYGRQICPDWIENILTSHPYISQACIYGEALPHNLCVIVPAHKDVSIDDLEKAINLINNELPDYARVNEFITASSAFTPDNRLLNMSGQLNRQQIWANYIAHFDSNDTNINTYTL
jgi:long-subunit acyl-CoA synthetase (AMP-forming)